MENPPASTPPASPATISSPSLSPSPPFPPSNRLSLPPAIRIFSATAASISLGFTMGLSHGSTRHGLLFRAENAHRLPTTPTGWYLYHKSKNYHMALGGVREGLKMGGKLGFWTFAFFGIEDSWDEIRGKRDAANTVLAALCVAGGWSLWNRFPASTAAKTAKQALVVGLGFGLAQDAVAALKGNRPGYVDFILRGGKRKRKEEELGVL